MANDKNKPGQQDTRDKEKQGYQETPEKGKGLSEQQGKKQGRQEEEPDTEELDK